MNNISGELEQPHEPGSEILDHLQRWIGDQDDHIDAQFHQLHDDAPNIMNSSLEILESIREAARVMGKKEMLDNLKHEFSHKENKQKPSL